MSSINRQNVYSALMTVTCLLLLASGIRGVPGPANLAAAEAPASVRPSDWSEPRAISNSPTTNSEAPSLIVTSTGIVHVVWEEGDDELYHSYREDGVWSEPSRVTTGEQPSLALGPGDTVHLIFINEFDGVYNAYHAAWDGESWSKPQDQRNVSQTSWVSDSPDLAVAADGSLHAVWVDQTFDGPQVYYGTSNDGTIWSASPVPNAYGQAPAVDVGPDDVVQATWQSVNYDIQYKRLEGDTWPYQNEKVSDTPHADSTAPDLAVGEDSLAHLVWQEEISGTTQIQYRGRGASWSDAITLSHTTEGAFLPGVTVDAEERVHVAWENAGYPFSVRHTWRPGPTSAWASPSTVAASTLPLSDVSLFAGPHDKLHAAWVEGEIGPGEVLYANMAFYHVFLPGVLRNYAAPFPLTH